MLANHKRAYPYSRQIFCHVNAGKDRIVVGSLALAEGGGRVWDPSGHPMGLLVRVDPSIVSFFGYLASAGNPAGCGLQYEVCTVDGWGGRCVAKGAVFLPGPPPPRGGLERKGGGEGSVTSARLPPVGGPAPDAIPGSWRQRSLRRGGGRPAQPPSPPPSRVEI